MKLAIIIPYRSRKDYLDIFLKSTSKYIESKNRINKEDYNFILAEQLDDKLFNRGLAINIGAEYANKYNLGEYFVFHDVDTIPLSGIDYKYNQLTEWWFLCAGGFKIHSKDFNSVNGFSNKYKGWGFEDTDFQDRLFHFNKDPFFWPKLGKEKKSTMLDLEIKDLESNQESKRYFEETMLRKGLGKYQGFPRYMSLKDLGIEHERADKSKLWYQEDLIKENKALLDKIQEQFSPEEKTKLYNSDGFLQSKSYPTQECKDFGNFHRIGFYTE